MKKHFARIMSLLLVFAILAGCGKTEETAADASLSATSIELTLGETSTLSVNDYTGSVIWSSTDENVVEVSSFGQISAIALGNAAVTARIDGDVTMSCIVSVKRGESSVSSIKVTGYYSSSSDITLDYSNTYNALLKATCNPSSENEKIIWASSNTNVATVDDSGYVTAHANGMTTITATAVNGVSGECIIRVKNATEDAAEVRNEENSEEETVASEEEEEETVVQPPESSPSAQSNIVISSTKIYLDVAEDCQLTVALSNEPEGTFVDWSTTDKRVAVVKYGRVVAVGEGIAVISAITTDGAVANCYVAVGKKAKKELQKQ